MAADRSDQIKLELEQLVLKTLDAKGTIPDSRVFLADLERLPQEQLLVGVLKSLLAVNYIEFEDKPFEYSVLSDEGKKYAEQGSPEVQLYHLVPAGDAGIAIKDAEAKLGAEVVKVAQMAAMKNRWLKMHDKQFFVRVAEPSAVVDTIRDQLRNLASVDKATTDALKKRKLCETVKGRTYTIRKGPSFALERKSRAADLSMELLKNDEWKNVEFKAYNLKAKGAPLATGALHPLMKVRTELRNILLEMGFEEMPTNNYVESAFWNFDALFQPQQHPARDSHDTFFLSAPATTKQVPMDYLERVRVMHEKGGHGSIGYRYDWSIEEAQKNILRTHTTAVSTRMLYQLGQQKQFTPKRYFSIDRVFRNEALDAKHLAEFHQVEGLIADRNLTLGDLIGVISTFFRRMGIEGVKFKPAYNPYTEPSMEIFGYTPDHGWMEIGNSGIFRPEMLMPMGLPEDVRVIAWGFGLERPTMIKYGVRDVRTLFGYKVDLKSILNNAIAKFED